jgi:hypothetical protein
MPHPINFGMPQPIFIKLGMYIMAPELIPIAYNIQISPINLYVYICIPPIVARQRISKQFLAAMNRGSAERYCPCRNKESKLLVFQILITLDSV